MEVAKEKSMDWLQVSPAGESILKEWFTQKFILAETLLTLRPSEM